MNKQNLTHVVDAIGAIADRARARDRDPRARLRKTVPYVAKQPSGAELNLGPALKMLEQLSPSEARSVLAEVPVTLRRQLMRAALHGPITRSGGTCSVGRYAAAPAAPAAKVPAAARTRKAAPPVKGRIRQALDDAALEALRREHAEYRLIARHEAGHTVAAWALGHSIRHVDIGWSGHCGETALTEAATDPQQVLVLLYAGPYAEKGSRCWKPAFEQIWHANDDHARIAGSWSNLGLGVRDEGVARTRVIGQVEELLDKYWRLVDDVAEQLKARRRLTGDELAKLLPKRYAPIDLVPMLGKRGMSRA